MEINNSSQFNKESNLLDLLLFRFLPYWPLFAGLLVICGAGAWLYLRYAIPVYEVSATLLLKDESKGVDDSRSVDFLNVYASKKIVENEIEVIRSKTVMRQVVDNLHLYAPVSEVGRLKTIPAYTSAPIIIEAKEPERLTEVKRVDFSYTPGNMVHIGGKDYATGQWVTSPYGVLKFLPNTHQTRETKNPLYFSLVLPKKVVNGLAGSLDVSAVSKLSTVINLTFKDQVPERGEDILNEVTAVYNRAAINEKTRLAANTIAFVDDRLKVVVGSLDSIERTIQQYKSEKGAIDLSEQSKLFLQNVGDNDRKLADINNQLAVLEQVEKYVASKNSGSGIVPATVGINDPVLKQLLDKLSEDELQYENLKQTIPENNSIMVSLKKEIEQIRPRVLENIHNQQANLQASKGNMSAAGNSISSVLQTIPNKERKLLEISRQQAIMNNTYSFLLQKREELAVSNAGMVTDSRIIDQGESSVTPVSPKKWFIYLAAIAAAMGLGVAIVMAKEFLTSKILFRSDIENYTKIPIAAEIAYVKHKNELVIDQPENIFIAEQFRQLRAAIGFYSKTVFPKKLLVTSSIAGEGKSFVAVNLALSLANSGKKVVLLDLDLRNPRTSSIFDLRQQKGIADYLEKGGDLNEIITKTGYHNLYVIPAGATSLNPTELFLNANLDSLFAHLENSFDRILIDTSPIDPVTDAFALSRYGDKILFVIRHNYTPKTIVQLLDENNKIKAFTDVAIVYNGVKKRGFVKSGYGFGYGYGYEYVYKERDLQANTKI